MIALILRDLKLAWRSGGAWLHGVLFCVLFTALCAIALGGDTQWLSQIGGALIWLAVIFSLLLSFDRSFNEDAHDGSLDMLALSMGLARVTTAKLISQWLLSVLPLIVISPAIGYGFGLAPDQIMAVTLSLLIGSPALILYGSFAGACVLGYRSAGLLVVLLTVPLLIPTLIFGLSAVDSFPAEGLTSPAFKALCGLSLLSIGLGVPAICEALKTYLETS